jgi:phosphopantothenoylcysteine synthetase/decarboxylase
MKILVTAGATWIKVDRVRILTSIFTGATGLSIAKAFKKKGHSVTLLINTHCIADASGVKVVPFRYFEEFKAQVAKELRSYRYDVIIHSAAVSDYTLEPLSRGKIPSGRRQLSMRLRPAEKVIKIMRSLAPRALLVQFKLEIKRKGLIEEAYKSLKENRSDLVIANALEDITDGYKAFIIDAHKHAFEINSRNRLPNAIYKAIFSKKR